MNQLIAIHCYVSGKVQGVWFRASTKEQADLLGVKGWVRNLADGRVELMACGEPASVESLYQWLNQGPALAKVTDLTREEVAVKLFTAFDIL